MLTTEKLNELQGHIVTRKVRKGEIIQMPGQSIVSGYYVCQGMLRSYTVDEKGKEHIFMFAPEDWIVSDIESHTGDQKTVLFIDALEDSEIEVIDRSLMDLQFDDIPKAAVRGEIQKLLKRIAVLQRRVILLMSASARERYEHFLETYPGIVQRVPQKLIASYLGITPEALSKIRGDISRRS